MTKRHRDAISIQGGACNPYGITRSLSLALDECRAEGKDTEGTCYDPAIRLIVHQLAYICGVAEIDNDLSTYGKLTKECEEQQ